VEKLLTVGGGLSPTRKNAANGKVCSWPIADGRYGSVYELIAGRTSRRVPVALGRCGRLYWFVADFISLWRTLLARHSRYRRRPCREELLPCGTYQNAYEYESSRSMNPGRFAVWCVATSISSPRRCFTVARRSPHHRATACHEPGLAPRDRTVP
jgi:hypothetical protein